MARKGRAEVEGGLYHVIARGNNRRRIFNSPADYDKFLSLLAVEKVRLPFFLYAYCLMTNHVHLLIERREDTIGRIMHRVLTGYSQYYNRRYRRSGHLLQGRHKAILCQSDRYLAELVRYIHLNPVRAKMVSAPEQYPYSDAKGNQTHITYGTIGSFSDLYPTEIKTAYGTSLVRTEDREYDFGTGLVTRVTDADNGVSTSTTYDALCRPTLVKAAEGKAEEIHTATQYSDADRRVTMRSDLLAKDDGKLVTIQHYDQLGRIRLARQLEDSTNQSATDETQGIKVQTRYLFSGSNSYQCVSNPYRADYSSNAGAEGSMGWTRSKSDNGGRLTEVQTFGGAGLPGPWGSNSTSTGTVTTAYNANLTTVTDQTSRVRRSVTDGLGRLVRVDEPDKDSGNLDDGNGNPVQPTSYAYDVLGNLLTVTQGSQTPRSFSYDSLSRLGSASNPESGTINYTYDNDGNLLTKTDARSVVATYVYDPLNRVTSRSYSDSTPTVTYSYDPNITYGKGRLASVSSSVSSYSYSSYDATGKVLAGSQTLGSQTYSLSYGYDLSGHLTSMTYPSGRTVSYAYDNLGRTSNFSGNLGDGTTRTYSTGITYASAGQMTQEQFGTATAIYNKLFYNSRGQLAEVLASTTGSDSSWNRGKIINDYSDQCSGVSCNGTNNNGNLRKQTTYVPNNEQNTSSTSWYQQYDYDSLNRLQRVHEYTGNTNLDWQQEYVYDVWGNRTVHQTNTFGTGIPKPNFSVNTANNRLGVPSGQSGTMTYDNAGNLITDTYSAAAVTRAYDAENRMTSETQANNYVAGSYSYDGDDRRAVRNVNGVVTWQVYGLGGELLAEYAQNGAATSPQKEYGYRNGQLLITAEAGTASAPPPSGLAVTPPASGANVTLNWTAASGATNYRVERKGAGGSFSSIGTTSSTTVNDSSASNGSAYLYKVCAADGAGNCTSSYSNIVLGARFNFPTDSTVTTIADDSTGINVTTMKLEHITELRTAVNAVRGLAALSAATWAHPTLTRYVSQINKDDVQELRTNLDEALTALGIQTSAYDDSTLSGAPTGTLIKGVHIRQLRERATSGIGGSGGAAGPAINIHWLVADQLGTPRMIFDQGGSLATVSRHDYLPFGEELGASVGGRTTGMGFSVTDGSRQKFTLKERDIETGLDYFGARYYANTQGRFTSVDSVAGYLSNPQSLNRYSYVLNNPLKFVDPTGMTVEWADSEAKKKKDEAEARTNAQRKYENHIAKLLGSKNAEERARGERLQATYQGLKDSKAVFRVVKEDSSDSSSGELKFNGTVFIVSLKGNANEYGAIDINQKIAHEFEHGRQVLDRELSYHNYNPPDWKPFAHDRTDEAKAFAAGFDATPVAPDQGSFLNGMRQAIRLGGIQAGVDFLGRSNTNYRTLPAGPINVTHRSPAIYEVPK